MPIIKSAKKAARQSVKRTKHNEQIKKTIKSSLKDFKKNPSLATLRKAQSEYDKAAKKGLIKKNTTSRRKKSLMKLAKAAGVKFEKTTKSAPKAEKAAKAEKSAKPATK